MLKHVKINKNKNMNLNKKQFWRGISILLNNYHAINRKLFACSIISAETIIKGLSHLKSNLNEHHEELIKENLEKSLLIPQLLQITKADIIENNIEGYVVRFKCIHKKGGSNVKALGILGMKQTDSIHFIFSNFNM